jgi:protein SCO1/2
MMWRAFLLGCVATCAHAAIVDAPLSLPPQPAAALAPKAGATLPLDANFVDDKGRAVRLRSFFGTLPVVLVPGYYRCRNLCTTVMDGVLETLAAVGLPPGSYRVLGVSFDPEEGWALAHEKHAAYAPLLAHAGADLRLLTGAAPQVSQLTRSIGLRITRDPQTGDFAHAAGFLVVAPDGRVSHVFDGVRFAPRDVRLALVEASAGRMGNLRDRLVLLCSHYDPRLGAYSVTALWLARGAGLLALSSLLAFAALQLRRRRR